MACTVCLRLRFWDRVDRNVLRRFFDNKIVGEGVKMHFVKTKGIPVMYKRSWRKARCTNLLVFIKVYEECLCSTNAFL